MLNDLIDATGWSSEQWLAVSIMAFVVLAMMVVVSRLLKIFRMTRKPRYQPVLRPLRRRRTIYRETEQEEAAYRETGQEGVAEEEQ